MIFVYLLSVFLLGLSYILSQKNIFSPGVITSAIWFVCLSLFFVLKHNLPPLSEQFIVSLSIWMTLLVLSSLFVQSLKFTIRQREPSQLVRDIYYYISLLTFPFLLWFAYNAIRNGETGSWTMDLRLAAIGKSNDTHEAYTPFYFQLWNVSYLIELFYFSKKNRKRTVILGLLCLSGGLLTMAKITIMNLFITSFSLLFFKKVISTKYVIYGLSALLLTLILFQSLRYSVKVDEDKANNMLLTYAVSSMSAYETVKPESSTIFGDNVFRLFYAIGYKTHITSEKPVDPLLPFVTKPIFTNTYTGMYPFYKDFGYKGIIIFSIFLGLIYGYIFRKSQKNDPYYLILYAYFCYVILMQYVADIFFTNLAGIIKFMILLYLPFSADKYKILKKNP